MSLYSEYLTERTNDGIIEDETGFATYRYLSEKEVYIVDIYTRPEHRKKHCAAKMADYICAKAKEKGCTVLIGTVNPTAKGSTDSLRVLLAYGMTLVKSEANVIVLKKDI